MAIIKGMKGLRYNTKVAGNLDTLVCPPYDIISDEQREQYLENNGYNIIRLELPKGENKYKDAGKALNEWIDKEVLIQDNKESIYVYEMEFTANGVKNALKGFVSLVKLEEFSKGIVLPHEETLSKAKVDRFNLMSETFCNFSQIYSLYMDEDGKAYSTVDACSQGKPDMEVIDGDGVIHRMWCVHEEKVLNTLAKVFEDKKLYIADGHHRYETALNFHKHLCENGISDENSQSSYIMMMLVNMENDGLVVFPTHRLVRDLDNFNIDDVYEKFNIHFDVTDIKGRKEIEGNLNKLYEQGKKAFAMYSGNDNFKLLVLKNEGAVKELMPEMSDSYCGLDVSVLHTLVLEKIFGIDKENMANQVNLTYTKIIDEAISSVDSGEANCSFILNPTKVSEIRDVALAREKMPQKSTYFYPKTITGLVVNKFK
ncbi:MAG: DUF1015 domain-containing protein [Clostridiales bacterium]|nr:DUF1015 domain-containing protein [Clostridiales bacterium]